MSKIDWDRVSKNLRCPICGEKASISPGTDGTQGEHTHRFDISREMARQLSQPSREEALQEMVQLRARMAELERITDGD